MSTSYRRALDPPGGDFALITRDLEESALAYARESPRRRVILPFHKHSGDPLHRMLNAVQPDSYIRPHRHLDYDKAASAIFTEPEIADVGLAEADAFASGRKIRVTKVPFSVSARALIDGDPRGFVKILSDPATGVVLGGSIVGRHAAELISVIALAVNLAAQLVQG